MRRGAHRHTTARPGHDSLSVVYQKYTDEGLRPARYLTGPERNDGAEAASAAPATLVSRRRTITKTLCMNHVGADGLETGHHAIFLPPDSLQVACRALVGVEMLLRTESARCSLFSPKRISNASCTMLFYEVEGFILVTRYRAKKGTVLSEELII